MNYKEINFRDMNIEEIYNTIVILKQNISEEKIDNQSLEYLYKEALELNNNLISNFAYSLNNDIEKKYEKIIIKLNNETLLKLKRYSDVFIKVYQRLKEKKYKIYYKEIAVFIENYLKNNRNRSLKENIEIIDEYSKEILKFDNIIALEVKGYL